MAGWNSGDDDTLGRADLYLGGDIVRRASYVADPDVGSKKGHGVRRHGGTLALERAQETHGRQLKSEAQAATAKAPVR